MSETTQTQIGDIVEGRVTGVTKYGAFVKLATGRDGLVHISEIANEFVADINQYVIVGQSVKVKVIGLNTKLGKFDLSIKQTLEDAQKPVDKVKMRPILKRSENTAFEDKLSSFLKKSEEKQNDLRRQLKVKQGAFKKRKP
jgi:S1 RNA binding domain protein